jgi:hypothetical protein
MSCSQFDGTMLRQEPTDPQQAYSLTSQGAHAARVDKFAGIDFVEQPSQSRRATPS